MSTQRLTSVDEAAMIIRRGGLIAFPTETVFGIGVDATNETAVKKLFAAKGRPSNNPLIVHLPDVKHWNLAAATLPDHAKSLLGAYAPGPLTVVVPKRECICSLVTAGLDTVGIRIPDHAVAQKILRKANVPVAAPSANLSKRPSGTTWQAVLEDLDGRIDAVYCENSHSIGIESTVVDCCDTVPVVLRPGAITIEQLRAIVPHVRELRSSGAVHKIPVAPDDSAAKSPGLLHAHYQPRAKVCLIDSPAPEIMNAPKRTAYCGMSDFAGIDALALSAVYTTVDDYASAFYEFLREADRRSVSMIYVQRAPSIGIGQALRDRQRRAAGN